MAILTNSQVLGGAGSSAGARLYREMIHNAADTYGVTPAEAHNRLCRAYGLDTDDQNGGTYWEDVVRQAVAYGDIDTETMELT